MCRTDATRPSIVRSIGCDHPYDSTKCYLNPAETSTHASFEHCLCILTRNGHRRKSQPIQASPPTQLVAAKPEVALQAVVPNARNPGGVSPLDMCMSRAPTCPKLRRSPTSVTLLALRFLPLQLRMRFHITASPNNGTRGFSVEACPI